MRFLKKIRIRISKIIVFSIVLIIFFMFGLISNSYLERQKEISFLKGWSFCRFHLYFRNSKGTLEYIYSPEWREEKNELIEAGKFGKFRFENNKEN